MKLFKLLYLGLLSSLFLFSACEDDGPEVYSGESDNFRFGVRAFSVAENSTTFVKVPIIFSKVTPRTGTATVTITGGTNGLDYELLNPNLTFDFGADKYSDTVYVRPIDNSIENEALILNLELSSSEHIGWRGDSTSQICTIRINDNDGCPSYDPGLFIGDINGVNSNGQSGLGGLDPIDGEFMSNITLAGGNDLTVTNIGGIDDTFMNAGSGAPNPCTVTLIPGVGGQQGTVEVSGSTGYSLTSGESIDYGGTGTYDICTGSMIIDWDLNYTGGLLFLGTATYTY